jgi:tight adherence protein C
MNDAAPLGILTLLLGAAGVGVLCLWSLESSQRASAWRRLARVVRDEAEADAPESELWQTAHRFGRWGLRYTGRLADPEVAQMLVQAGWRGRERFAVFASLRLMVTVLALAGTLAASSLGMVAHSGSGALMLAFAAGAVAYLAPKMLLGVRVSGRMAAMREDVTAYTQLLRVLFDAGLSLEQCLRVLVRDGRSLLPALHGELELVVRQISAGQERNQALHAVAEELRIPELRDLVRLLGQIDQYGGSVQTALAQFAELLIDRQRTDLQERVAKLSAKLTLVMIAFLFPALLVFVGGPGFIALLRALERANG